MIHWGTPKYIQEETKFQKYQFKEPALQRKIKRSKICKFTKTKDHSFTLKKEERLDWWPKTLGGATIFQEWRCECGKKKTIFSDISL